MPSLAIIMHGKLFEAKQISWNYENTEGGGLGGGGVVDLI